MDHPHIQHTGSEKSKLSIMLHKKILVICKIFIFLSETTGTIGTKLGSS
jgi:hypothetical protein